jgi:glucose/arabinose dehydrogenase
MRRLIATAALFGAIAPAAHGQAGVSYQIPADNPFVGQAGAAPEVYALGLRNPFRFSFDRQTGDLLIGDVGGDQREEIDWIGSREARGANFGWPCREGKAAGPIGPPDPRCPAAAPPYVEPLFDYPTDSPDAVTGGFVVRDPTLPGLAGRALYADYYTGTIFSLALDRNDPGNSDTGLTIARLPSFGEDASGRLYAVDLDGGQVHRLIPGSSAGTLSSAVFSGGLNMPVALATFPGDSSRLVIAEKAGRLRLAVDFSVQPGNMLDLSASVHSGGLNAGDERGFLSVVLAPDYAATGKLYGYYNDPGGDIQIDEFRRSAGDPNVIDPATRRSVLTIEHSAAGNHNGGQLHFGPDGCLWITTGDGGGQNDQHNNAQNLGTHLGKILRIDPDPVGPVCGGAAPPGGGPGAGGIAFGAGSLGDTTGPRLTARVKRRQRVLRLRGAVAYLRCDEPCSLSARGRLHIGRRSYRMRPAARSAQAERRMRMKVGLTRPGRRALRRALRRGRSPAVRLRLRARDAVGNLSPLVRRTVLVRR